MGAPPTSVPLDPGSQTMEINGRSATDSYTIHVPEEHDAGGYARDDHEASYDISLDPEDRTAVFDLALKDDSSDGGLLDWETFAGKHRYTCCGCDCSCMPCCACVPPAWWYSYSKRQRLLMQSCAYLCGAVVLVAGGIGVTVWYSLSTCHGGFMC